jgi:hypothetical protein
MRQQSDALKLAYTSPFIGRAHGALPGKIERGTERRLLGISPAVHYTYSIYGSADLFGAGCP